MDLPTIMRLEIKAATDCMVSLGEMATQFTIFGRDGDIVPIVCPEFAEHRGQHISFVRLAAIAYDAEFISHVSEAWMAGYHTDELIKRLPAEREDRLEIVFIYVVSRTTSDSWIGLIERDTDGKVTGLKQYHSPDVVQPVYALFPAERPTAEHRAQALRLLEKNQLPNTTMH